MDPVLAPSVNLPGKKTKIEYIRAPKIPDELKIKVLLVKY